MANLTRTLAALLLAAILATSAFAGEVNDVSGQAIGGYDPVAYFTEGRPLKGSPGHAATHRGATFHFATAANRDRFAADPDRYAPQYGGFCAFGASRGYKADTDPDAFTIVDGKLYLNYNQAVRSQWQKDVPGHVAKADANWPSVKEQSDVVR